MVLRLWVPLTHRLLARNRNAAISGWALTASSVANSVGTSTPLRAGRCAVVVIIWLLVWSEARVGLPRRTLGTVPPRGLPLGGRRGKAGGGRLRRVAAMTDRTATENLTAAVQWPPVTVPSPNCHAVLRGGAYRRKRGFRADSAYLQQPVQQRAPNRAESDRMS